MARKGYLERLKEYRESLCQTRERYRDLACRTKGIVPSQTLEMINAYESVIRGLEKIFPELDKLPVASKLR